MSNNFTECVLESIDNQLRQTNFQFRYNNRRIIVVTDRNGDAMNKIFATRSLQFVTNFLLLFWNKTIHNEINSTDSQLLHPDTCSKINLYTHKYVGIENDSHLPLLLDTFDGCANIFERNASLFPDKLTNQHGRPLRILISDLLIPRGYIRNLRLNFILINV